MFFAVVAYFLLKPEKDDEYLKSMNNTQVQKQQGSGIVDVANSIVSIFGAKAKILSNAAN